MRLKEGTVFWNKEPKSLVTKHCGMWRVLIIVQVRYNDGLSLLCNFRTKETT